MKRQQSSQAVLMVRPTSFGFDEQTAQSNAFQHKPTANQRVTLKHANEEFQRAVDTLAAHNIDVVVFEDEPAPAKPNAVFPNNWLSTWPDGRIFLYPMATESRRSERTPVVLDALKRHFAVTDITDLSSAERDGNYLESTGVIIFDHVNRVAYACLSVRCDETLFTRHVTALGYQPIIFHAYDQHGTPIYHTNVMMGVQSTTAVICLDAITDKAERAAVVGSLTDTGHDIIAISHEQMSAFCGNVLELRNRRGDAFLALSQTAYDNFTLQQRERLARDKTLLPLMIPTIENIGGGSVRCMLAELFLQ